MVPIGAALFIALDARSVAPMTQSNGEKATGCAGANHFRVVK
jgi:hypothetical protein